jgi:hypothetical protein
MGEKITKWGNMFGYEQWAMTKVTSINIQHHDEVSSECVENCGLWSVNLGLCLVWNKFLNLELEFCIIIK